MLDGQHRLLACIKADVSFPSLIVWGLSNDSQCVIDDQKKRTVGDQLQLNMGLKNSKAKVALANSIVSVIKTDHVVLSANTAKDIIDLYEDEMDIIFNDCGKLIPGLRFTPTVAGIVIAAKVNMDKAICFRDKYFSGAGLFRGDPALTLRNFMLSCIHGRPNGITFRIMMTHYSTLALMHEFLGTSFTRMSASSKGTKFFLEKQQQFVDLINDCLDI